MNIGHGDCVRFVKSFGLPTIVIGGGGYTIRNVARCWADETSVLLDTPVPDELPINRYFEYYGPDYLSTFNRAIWKFNSHQYLTKTRDRLLRVLKVSPRLPCQFKRGSLERRKLPAILPPAPEEEVDPDKRNVEDLSLGFQSIQSDLFLAPLRRWWCCQNTEKYMN